MYETTGLLLGLQTDGASNSATFHSRPSLAGKDYPAALEHLHAALKIWPVMVEAHARLSATYRAMGDKDKSQAEPA